MKILSTWFEQVQNDTDPRLISSMYGLDLGTAKNMGLHKVFS